MVRKVEHAARNAGDRYITTPEAAVAIGAHLVAHYLRNHSAPVFDPACASLTLPEWAGLFDCRGIDITPVPGNEHDPRITIGDALAMDWPTDRHIIANPPFLLLAEFVRKIAAHCDEHRLIGAILTPAAFWHASSRMDLPTPHEMLALTWRPNFSCGLRADGTDGAAPSADYVWAIYDGEASTAQHAQWSRLTRPSVPDEWVRLHERLARLSAGLTPQGAAPLLDEAKGA